MEEYPRHILEGKQIFGGGFVAHVPVLLNAVPAQFGLPTDVLDFDWSCLALVDRAIDRTGVEFCLQPNPFCSLVAFVGEFENRYSDSCWQMRPGLNDMWEPWVVSSHGSRAPFLTIYNRLDSDEGFCPLAWAVRTDVSFLCRHRFNR